MIIYVDDLTILASDMDIMKGLKFKLEEQYDMSDLGELHFFLGVHIERDRAADNITMHQSVEDIRSNYK